MADDLGARLVRAGLVTRAQLLQALASAPAHGGALVEALADGGVAEEALVGFFVAAGYVRATSDALAAPAPAGVRSVSVEMARECLVLPLSMTETGLVVAMADPSDAHVNTELRYALAVQVLPVVAAVSDLRRAIERRHAVHGRARVETGEDVQPIDLVRRRAGTYAGSTKESERALAKDRSRPRRISSVAELPLLLVRTKAFRGRTEPPAPVESRPAPPPAPLPASKVTVARTFARPDRRAPEAPEPERQTRDYVALAPPTSSRPPPADDTWTDIPREASTGPGRPAGGEASGKLSASARRSVLPPPPPSAPPAGMADTLAAIRGAATRDEVVAIACDAALGAGRCAVFLALRRGILRGWEGRGAGLTRDAIRNLWIPATSPSRMRDVLEQQGAYVGPHGPSAADNIFKAATANRGGDVLLQPVVVSGKVVGLLCVDDVDSAELSRDRAEVLAIAISDAFRRIIVAGKAS